MKLHKQPAASTSDFSGQGAHLAEKYLGRMGSQVPFSGGRYPPSRDGSFNIQKEEEEFKEMVKGGTGHVPLTSEPKPPFRRFSALADVPTVHSQTTSTLSISERSV